MTQIPASQTEKVTSVLGFLAGKSEKYADRVALCIKEGESWRGLTYGQLSKQAIRLASYLIEIGIERGDRVVLLSESKPEWGVAFFSGVRSGAIMVPMDIKLTESEIYNIINDCTPKVVLCDAKHKEVVARVAERVSSIKHIFIVDEGKGDEKHPSIETLEPKVLQTGVERELDEVALFVYTSGTTGNPKGVMTTFGNLIFQVNSFKDMVDLTEEDKYLSILPLNHLLELTGGFLGLLNQGGTICFCSSLFPQEIIKTMREKEVTGMIAVPLFFKALKGGIEREIKKAGEDKLAAFQGGLQKAAALPMAQRKQLFAAVHEQLGGKVRVFISGGAPLEMDVAEFFDRLGIPILQGYGLTETSPVSTGNTLKANRLGSVGPALKGVELKIDIKNDTDTEGEILTRGPHIMKGYYKRDDLTAEVIDKDGYFHTGDLGHVDEDGFLFITGRIKNLIVLGGGKKVFPEEVEAALGTAASIKELCVMGKTVTGGSKEGTEEVVAVVVPADAVVHANKDNPVAVKGIIEKDLDKLAENLASYKRPSKIFIHSEDLPKTATRKVKRPAVVEWLKTQN